MPRTRLSLFASLGLGLLALGCTEKKADSPAAATTTAAAKAAPTDTARAGHRVFAASAHLRVVDAADQKVVGKVQLQKAVRRIVFSQDGLTAYVAASDGVRAVDTTTFEVIAKLTDRPARYVELDSTGHMLHVLEHWVHIAPNGARTPQPFSLVTIDTRTGAPASKVEVGERVLYARAAEGEGGHWIRVTELGEVSIGTAETPWGEGTKLDPTDGAPDAPYRVRKTIGHHGAHVYLPIESDPARVLDIDTKTGRTRMYSLGEKAAIRGVGVTPDGATLIANTGKTLKFVDLSSGDVTHTLALPDTHVGCTITDDGRTAYLARVVDGKGGAVTAIDLTAKTVGDKVHLDDITPWAIAVQPRARLAAN